MKWPSCPVQMSIHSWPPFAPKNNGRLVSRPVAPTWFFFLSNYLGQQLYIAPGQAVKIRHATKTTTRESKSLNIDRKKAPLSVYLRQQCVCVCAQSKVYIYIWRKKKGRPAYIESLLAGIYTLWRAGPVITTTPTTSFISLSRPAASSRLILISIEIKSRAN